MTDPAAPPPLPYFPYHPDPLATGSLVPSRTRCACCGQPRGYVYAGPVYAVAGLSHALCPWCLADGSAAARYEAQFTEVDGRVPADVVRTVEQRTPGFGGWQQERWLTHCEDAAVFLGRAGIRELTPHPDALEALAADFGEEFLSVLDADGQPTAYLFRCRHCARHLAYADFT
ncbi:MULTISPECIES: CbrC family protein [unclassified Streptomyces]|uniref:CbrC family protein n=1 Tax=unclassified Streptomyces TaxID=2593676 RepID=UPI002E811399|nr:CbrC family protein [Streptomyces sp. NBC_00589]WTI38726.1 CbrC family protein [Streptomyces sp. NBC_00775]WUB27594.1 CbrC family protein [Streptomyces sp. NBC_00589]